MTWLRKGFLDFFRCERHEILESSPVIRHNDPTLMFVNAGMVPFKHFFTGEIKAVDLNVASCQKCLRAGGKHNDLENVGHTDRHHTFFEMLGNFSFGGYFKEEAICMAWDFIVNCLGLEKSRLYATVHNSDEESGDLWAKFLPRDKILSCGDEDNFWRMGDTGPCGPCSEIFYQIDNKKSLEVWNLVFMQYYDDGLGNLSDLPRRCVDTGMGLERILSVVEGVFDNYKTSLFTPLIQASKELSGFHEDSIGHRVIVDHLRSSAFLIADGLIPSNNGRGYVLRRIIRRAIRHVYKIRKLGKDKFLPLLVPVFIEVMAPYYKELTDASELIAEVLAEEEEKFLDALARGMNFLDKAKVYDGKLRGDDAFKLYDTYGFPLDLTLDLMRERKIEVDVKGFEQSMDLQKKRSIWSGSGENYENSLLLELYNRFGATEFCNAADMDPMKVEAIVEDKGSCVASVDSGKFIMVADKTIFYAESGGQEGDKGSLNTDSGDIISVEDTKKVAGGLFLHHCVLQKGKLHVGDSVFPKLDHSRRIALSTCHSATHLLHYALRKFLGSRVLQKGSLVASEYLRFDFSYNKKLSKQEIRQIEECVQEAISQKFPVIIEVMSHGDAIKKGAMAIFGEKYGDQVRVVKIGPSMELCGGTHIGNTSEIGFFKIASEESVGTGLRRVKAFVGSNALKYINDTVMELEGELSAAKEELVLVKKSADKDKQCLYSRIFRLVSFKKRLTAEGTRFLCKGIADYPAKYLRSAVLDAAKCEINSVVMVGIIDKGKTFLVVAVNHSLEDKINSNSILNEITGSVNVSGGGNNRVAQIGGFEWKDFDSICDHVFNNIP